MSGFFSGFAGGMEAGGRIAQRGMDNYEKRESEETEAKLFQSAMNLQGEGDQLAAAGAEREGMINSFKNASVGDMTAMIVDGYSASGGKINDKTYKMAMGVANTLFGLRQKEEEYQQGNTMFGLKQRKMEAEIGKFNRANQPVDGNQPLSIDDQLKVERTRKLQRERQESKTKEQDGYDRSIETSDRVIETIDRILEHNGLEAATGMSSWMSNIPGTDAKDVSAIIDTFESQAFVKEITNMKGMGALSDAEGKKLSSAITNLDRDQSLTAFKTNLMIAKKIFYNARAKAAKMRGGNTQQREVVERRTAPNGRTIVQYSDGTYGEQ